VEGEPGCLAGGMLPASSCPLGALQAVTWAIHNRSRIARRWSVAAKVRSATVPASGNPTVSGSP